MPGHVIDSEMFGNSYSTPRMREVFASRSVVQSWIDAESALARAQADVGLVPREAAEEISRRGLVDDFDLVALGEGIAATSHTLMPFLRRYQELCSEEHRGYLHWGATTQDIVDTGTALRMRRALDIIAEDLAAVRERLRQLAEEHAETVMPGRTHGQQALPITFGYKVATWLAEVDRHHQRLAQLRPRVLVGNLNGAVGTMAFVGEVGLEVQARALGDLGLGVPEICWHSSRDRVAEMAGWLAMAGTTLGRIGREVYQLQKTEFGELEEAFPEGRVGSSTMPQKRNPATSESIVAKAVILKAQAQLGYDAMMQEHERDKALWQTEWEFLPEMFMLMGGITADSRKVLDQLVVDGDRMRRNTGLTGGLIMAESIMLKLAEVVGRHEAHDLVYDISMRCAETGTPFADALKADVTVRSVLGEDAIDRHLDPLRYTGLAARMARAAAAPPG
ncbi:adenylosuccinate lyase family protein [Geodermatophilus sp. DSM 45219]|uniref:class-II fumarase/aspartase family protein n=1 Tax=Geodermatophilus sp. DSM 45219 TaxID=1881103 RepID=UPI00088EBCA7|nr:adenylosuccinate lyase family protein [Geodermatophilus sp. DSM 45219]SDN56324.1 3-carboxy-cis,cis-muconate cycloisomerase [Geodermatophilus sp. DSM 45219]